MKYNKKIARFLLTFALVLLLGALFATGSLASTATSAILNFEGLGNQEPIGDFYNGGFGGLGSGPGPDYGIRFGPDALALIDADAGGTGNFANEPSPNSVAFFLTGPGVIMNVDNGFTTGFSFFYSAEFNGSVTVYDGLDGTGNVLATLVLTKNLPCGAGDPTGYYACWVPTGIGFTGTAYSANFSGAANFIGFDDITVGSIIPDNLPPIADANGPYTGDEGSSISMDGTGSYDPEGNSLTYSWTVDSTLCSFDNSLVASPNLTCADNGNFTVTLAVNDGLLTAETTADVTVNNVAPTVNIDSVAPALVAINTAVTASGSFTDPGTLDTHTAVWDWGDGSTSAGSVSGLSVGPDSHSFTQAGIYTIQLAVTDNDDATGNASYEYVVVYDPNAGFVTGGGWFDSPPGAFIEDPSLTGKANFGFVSKYQKGANIPTGNTEFQFQTADLNFHSLSYDWLVVTGSNYARYKGVGTINGEGEYLFMLWAGDGTGSDGADTFRIKIWTEDSQGVETVVYDNGMDQAISNGSIVVHSK